MMMVEPDTAQLSPEVSLARMLLGTVPVLALVLMAPPLRVALLPEKVLLVTVSVPPLLTMAPPSVALLPEKVLLVTVSVPPLSMAPPAARPPAAVVLEQALMVVRVVAAAPLPP